MRQRESMELRTVYRTLRERLQAVSDDPAFEAQELLRSRGFSREAVLVGNAAVSDADADWLEDALRRRAEGYPLQYLLGEWEFFGRTYSVGEGVLIPRADTETLVETALGFAGGRSGLRIADLCAGTGCIGLTLALELPQADVTCVEKSEEALRYLRANAARYPQSDLRVVADDVLSPREEYPPFDLIVSNPPYIDEAGMRSLQREVTFEPELALAGGTDGLDFYRELPRVWAPCLKPGGMLAVEIGQGQEAAVVDIFKNNRFENVCTARDLCGIIRVVSGVYAPDRN